MKKICIKCIKLYQKHLSGMKKAPTCKYYPSCSEYAARAYETHGFFGGTALSLYRIVRCNPWSMGGVDYVPGTPERKDWEKRQREGYLPDKNENNCS
jgi:putative membrane protein insertion efficiency factor